jgi:hypothetical protein
MKTLVLLLFCLPGLLFGETKVLVDAIPSEAMFVGSSPFRLPFQDAESQDPKSIEIGMSSAISGILQSTAQQGFSYICLLSAPGDDPVEVLIPAANAKLKLRRTKTSVTVVFYKGGAAATTPVSFSAGQLDASKPHVSLRCKKISVPPGITTSGWIYFNLSRIQAEAAKAGSHVAMLQTEGTGAVTQVAIPGMKEPLMVHEDQTTLTASWYIDAAMEARLRNQVPGPQSR